MKIDLQRVQFIPNELQPGVLYVAEEFGAAVHLCPCGCGSKIRTPLGPTDWSFRETGSGPSLYPSIGNWQQRCRSHYWIHRGRILWSDTWTDEEIEEGRRDEQTRARAYYKRSDRRREKTLGKLSRWVKGLFKK